MEDFENTENNEEVMPIPFSVVDNTDGGINTLKNGYYFTIGDFTEQDENDITNGVNLEIMAGPYDTEQDAVDAAVEEIIELMRTVIHEIGGENVSTDFSGYNLKKKED